MWALRGVLARFVMCLLMYGLPLVQHFLLLVTSYNRCGHAASAVHVVVWPAAIAFAATVDCLVAGPRAAGIHIGCYTSLSRHNWWSCMWCYHDEWTVVAASSYFADKGDRQTLLLLLLAQLSRLLLVTANACPPAIFRMGCCLCHHCYCMPMRWCQSMCSCKWWSCVFCCHWVEWCLCWCYCMYCCHWVQYCWYCLCYIVQYTVENMGNW